MVEFKLAVEGVLPDLKNELNELEKELELARVENEITDLDYYDNLRSRINKLRTITDALEYRFPKIANSKYMSCPRCEEKLELLIGSRLPNFCPACGQMIEIHN